uniref:DUF148 domain-containing protein n=1 Tax=Syphacia muris TaxID=451379 RepID=A0A0N5AKZ5_9BILA
MFVVYVILGISYACVVYGTEKLTTGEANGVTISEQLDPRYFIQESVTYPFSQFIPYRSQSAAYENTAQNLGFDFRCRCNTKLDQTTAQQPEIELTGVTPELREQIKQLQEQIKKQAAQLRRQQQIASQQSGFEQIASLATISDGFDCSCSGTIPNSSDSQQRQPELQQQFGFDIDSVEASAGAGFMLLNVILEEKRVDIHISGYGSRSGIPQNAAGVPLTSPFNTPLMPLQPFPLLP